MIGCWDNDKGVGGGGKGMHGSPVATLSEVGRAKMVLDRVQTTYQTKLMEYEIQATATTDLIKQLKNEKEAIEDKVKMGIQRIRMIVGAWRD